MGFLSDEERALLAPAETDAFASPIPTQIVSSDEYLPPPQSAQQREVEARLKRMGAELAARQGVSRRRFFQTASGMATAFLAMNQVFGPLFEVSAAEAATPDMADARAKGLSDQFIMDMHTHFLKDDTRINTFAEMRNAVGKAGWNKALADKEQTKDDLKFDNYFKEIFLDSDTKVALISSAPSDVHEDWFLTNGQMAVARTEVNARLGARRMFSHFILTPGQPGWLDAIDEAVEVNKPDSWKGYTIGDNTHKDLSKYPWRLDDEKLMYPAYAKFVKSGIHNVCIHKGLFPPSAEKQFPNLRRYVDVSDVGKAAKDWPQLNFVIYHSGYRLGPPDMMMEAFDKTGRIEWVTDLSEVPAKYGVKNVYGDVGQVFAMTAVSQPRLAAAIMGQLVKGLGASHVVWGTDAVWTGAPQWQIEALRRLEIPEDMQQKYAMKPLGPADGALKNAVFGENSARLYNYHRAAELGGPDDRLPAMKAAYEEQGPARSNLRYGYIRKA
jgi:predicted TIM-barrel fold metal-dependent hydrolase